MQKRVHNYAEKWIIDHESKFFAVGGNHQTYQSWCMFWKCPVRLVDPVMWLTCLCSKKYNLVWKGILVIKFMMRTLKIPVSVFCFYEMCAYYIFCVTSSHAQFTCTILIIILQSLNVFNLTCELDGRPTQIVASPPHSSPHWGTPQAAYPAAWNQRTHTCSICDDWHSQTFNKLSK